jgi:RHS repeat-associated protein
MAAGTYLPTWNGHGDALALWRQNADGTLTLANSYTYGTWGTPVTATHNGIGDLGFRFLYVGAADVQWDDFSGAGLLYMHARHYSPLTGRFLQPDPSAAETNLYGYAGANPTSTVDPTGEATPMEGLICFLLLGFGCREVIEFNDWAQHEAAYFFGSKTVRDVKGDAFKHCCWSAILTWAFGERAAKTLTDAHERYGGDTPSSIDYHNNRVGRWIGAGARRLYKRKAYAKTSISLGCYSHLSPRWAFGWDLSLHYLK